MKVLSLFLTRILPYVANCPQPTAEEALVDAAIEFCEHSQVVQRTLATMDTEAGEFEYTMPVPQYQAVAMPLRVWFKGTELEPIAADAVRNPQAFRSDIPDVTNATGNPREFYSLAAGQLGLYPMPAVTEPDTLTVRAAMKPTRAAVSLEDVLFENWVETLAAGALYRLHSTPGQAYTDTREADRRFTEFARGKAKAKIEATRGRVHGGLSVTMRPLA